MSFSWLTFKMPPLEHVKYKLPMGNQLSTLPPSPPPRLTRLSCLLTILVYCQPLTIWTLLSRTTLIPFTSLLIPFLYHAFSIYQMLLRTTAITNSCFVVLMGNRTCTITISGQFPYLPPPTKFTPTLLHWWLTSWAMAKMLNVLNVKWESY